jgi:hypothetical protein
MNLIIFFAPGHGVRVYESKEIRKRRNTGIVSIQHLKVNASLCLKGTK